MDKDVEITQFHWPEKNEMFKALISLAADIIYYHMLLFKSEYKRVVRQKQGAKRVLRFTNHKQLIFSSSHQHQRNHKFKIRWTQDIN